MNWTHRCKTRVKVNSFGQAGCLRQAKAAPLRRSLVFREVRTNSVANAFSSKDSPNWVDHWRHATTSSPRIPRKYWTDVPKACLWLPPRAGGPARRPVFICRLERGYHSDAPRTWEPEIWLLYTPDSWNVCDDEAGELRALLMSRCTAFHEFKLTMALVFVETAVSCWRPVTLCPSTRTIGNQMLKTSWNCHLQVSPRCPDSLRSVSHHRLPRHVSRYLFMLDLFDSNIPQQVVNLDLTDICEPFGGSWVFWMKTFYREESTYFTMVGEVWFNSDISL